MQPQSFFIRQTSNINAEDSRDTVQCRIVSRSHNVLLPGGVHLQEPGEHFVDVPVVEYLGGYNKSRGRNTRDTIAACRELVEDASRIEAAKLAFHESRARYVEERERSGSEKFAATVREAYEAGRPLPKYEGAQTWQSKFHDMFECDPLPLDAFEVLEEPSSDDGSGKTDDGKQDRRRGPRREKAA